MSVLAKISTGLTLKQAEQTLNCIEMEINAHARQTKLSEALLEKDLKPFTAA